MAADANRWLKKDMTMQAYPKAAKYPDLKAIYDQSSGPGALKLTEFIADKLNLQRDWRIVDIGTNRGIQTCFLAKEYDVFVVGIDPGRDRYVDATHVDLLMGNARAWSVHDRVFGVQVGVPDTKFAESSFDAAYSTTTLEMIRGSAGEERYRECLAEVRRILRPGALFGYGDPMHLPVEIPPDLAPLVEGDWAKFFATLDETLDAFRSVGFEVVESGYAPDAREWWEEYAREDPECQANPDGDPRTIAVDRGRWVSFGYVIARKPEEPTKESSTTPC